MRTLPHLVRSAVALAAAGLLLVGCAAGGDDSAPTSTDDDAATSGPSTAPDDDQDLDAAWLDGGRMFAIVSWGSSTCIPAVDTISADGQTVSLSLVDVGEADTACTADFAPRASVAALPDGVDPTQDVEFRVTIGDDTDDVDLDGADGLGSSEEFAASAGWFDDDGIVLLTWGSSTCAPVVQDVAVATGGATVTFAEQDGVCTMDMAPRATIIGVPDDDDDDADDDDAPYTLTLVGGGLDGTVEVIGD